MPHLSPKLITRIDQKLERLQALRPLPSTAVQKLQEKFEIEMTYNSNAIEGNSLTLKETFLVINEGLTIKGKPLKDHLEAKDHHEALELVYELVNPEAQPTLSSHLIRTLHQLVVQKTEEEFAGTFRTSAVYIGGSTHIPPSALQVPLLMQQLVTWFVKNQQRMHPIELAALLHHKLVFIHPFFDGNGRTARLVMNLVLMRAGYPLAIILKNDRHKYYKALQASDDGKLTPLVKFVAQSVERSLDIYLKTLTPATQRTEDYQLLSVISKDSPYSKKYLNLLARQGKLEAHKQGRDWLSSKESVIRYIEQRERQRKIKKKKED